MCFGDVNFVLCYDPFFLSKHLENNYQVLGIRGKVRAGPDVRKHT